MSLVRTMLSGVYESTNYIESMNIRDDVYVSEDGMYDPYGDKANEALVLELYQIDRAYHTADVIGEVKVLTEGADPEVLLEAIGGSAIDRIKMAFKKFWEKIKSWFAAIKRQLNMLFKTGKDFIKEFKSELVKKTVKGYSYTTYKYDFDKGDSKADGFFSAVEESINRTLKLGKNKSYRDYDTDNAFTKSMGSVRKSGAANSGYQDYIADNSNEDISDIQEKFLSEKGHQYIPASEIDDVRTELIDIYHDGDDDRTEYEDFESNSKSTMITYVETMDKKIKAVADDEKKFDKTMNAIIKAYENLKKEDMLGDKVEGNKIGGGNARYTADEAKAKNEQIGQSRYNTAQYIARRLNAYLALGKIPCDVKQSIYREAASEFEKVLKGYLRFKPAKESYYYDEESVDESTNIFEQAMKMI